jgi:hypothetical protein
MADLVGLNELFEFDLNGYVVIRGFLPRELVADMNRVLDSQPSARDAHKFDFILTHLMFMDVMSDRRILDVCHEWIDPFFRFDHAWGVQHYPNEPNPSERENLHGGPYAEQSCFQYHWKNDRPTCSCIIFAYALEPQLAGDGGFILVPGSHKSNLGLSGSQIAGRLLSRHQARTRFVAQPELDAGDLLIFTEATMHGTAAWNPLDRRRRNIYYKYGYGSMGWPPWDNPEAVELRRRARNEQERRLLRQPYVSTTTGNRLDWRTPTLVPDESMLRSMSCVRRLPTAGHDVRTDRT